MDHEAPHHSEARGNFLALFLAALAAFGFFVFLVMISGGLFFYMALVAGGVALLGVVNYMLWGRSFNREMAGEREEERLRQMMEDDEPWLSENRPQEK